MNGVFTLSEQEYKKICHALHKEAVERGDDHYIDPKTGYMVFTALYHKRRGHCCRSGCRHCAYGFRR